MDENNQQSNYSGPTTTANSAEEGRLRVDVRRKIIKKHLKKQHERRK